MSTMTISLPESTKEFADAQGAQKGYGSCNESVHGLVRGEQDRQKLHRLLLEGLAPGPGRAVDAGYSHELRARIHEHARPDTGAAGKAAAARRAAKPGVR